MLIVNSCLSTPDFRAIFEAAPTPFLVLTPALTIAAVNDAYLNATCKTRQDIIGRDVFTVFPDNPNDPKANGVQNLRDSLLRVLRNKTTDTMAVQKYDIPIGSPEEGQFEERYWSPINTPVMNDKGEISHIIHRVEDVTGFVKMQSEAVLHKSTMAAQAQEIRAANQRLRASELHANEAALQLQSERRRLDAVLEAAPVGIFVADEKGALILSNSMNRHLWGMNQPLTQSVHDYSQWKGWWADGSTKHGERIEPDEWAIARALRGEETPQDIIEVETFHTPPVRRTVLASAAPIRGEQEKITGAVVAIMDITDRMQAEQALRLADRRKDEFLAMLAHELRNPLAPIGTAADLLQLVQADEARIKQTSSIISRQVKHMTGLIDDLLDVSRVTRGLITLEKNKVDTKRIVFDAIEQIRPLIEERGHRLSVHTPADSAFVLGDQKRLVQVVTNLLVNAAKYTPECGEIDLTMKVDEAKVTLIVADNGIGMEPELAEQAFELFVQAKRTADRSQGGLGIGLALVKNMIEMHGGSVTAYSEGLGKGSKFTIFLPHLLETAVAPDSEPALEIIARIPKQLKVMVVDDNADAAQMLAMLIEALGYHVFVEFSSRKALERARIERPDICLLDIGLPDMDGNELARRLRTAPETAGATLIAVTGYGQEQDRKNALSAGFDHHFVKPLDTSKLFNLLAELTQSKPKEFERQCE